MIIYWKSYSNRSYSKPRSPVAQSVTKLYGFNLIRVHVTMFRTACHSSLFWAWCIQSITYFLKTELLQSSAKFYVCDGKFDFLTIFKTPSRSAPSTEIYPQPNKLSPQKPIKNKILFNIIPSSVLGFYYASRQRILLYYLLKLRAILIVMTLLNTNVITKSPHNPPIFRKRGLN